jgi:protocatechuate 3,4-dioxygenase beta subunit
MIRLVRIWLFLLFSPLVLGQLAFPAELPSATPSTQLCTVEGMVVSATTGLPLHKISLQLYSRNPAPASPAGADVTQPQSYSAISDSTGQFTFSSVAPGNYTLIGQGNHYPYQIYRQHRHGGPTILRLAVAEDLKNVVFRLEPGVVITGKVLDEDGDPISEVSVQAFIRVGGRLESQYAPHGGAQTDDLGEFRIWGLEPGKYLLEASPVNTRASASGGIYLPEFYPGTTDPSQATPIEGHPGDMLAGIDITLTPSQPATVSGQVIDGRTGIPVMAANLFLQSNFSALTEGYSGTSNTLDWGPQGRFRMTNVAPGSWILVANARSDQTALYAQLPVNLSPGENLSGLQVTLMPSIELSGRLSADPSPALNLRSLWINLQPSFSNGLPQPASAGLKPDGTFVVQNIPPGKFRINVAGFPPQYYLKSASLDGADVLENGLTLTAGEPPGTLDLFLSLDGGSIQGTVLNEDGKPVEGAVVALIPDPPRRDRQDLYSSVRTDPNGLFKLPGLAPGDYKLFVWEDLEHNSFEDPDFIRLFEDRGKEVEVRAREQQQVQLQVIPASAMPTQ